MESKGLLPDVGTVFDQTRKWFEEKGAKIDVVDLPILDASIASYYVIALSEAASNLSRFDGEFAAAAKRGASDSMPVGIQFAGPMFSEAKILRVAAAWEAEHPGCGCPIGE